MNQAKAQYKEAVAQVEQAAGRDRRDAGRAAAGAREPALHDNHLPHRRRHHSGQERHRQLVSQSVAASLQAPNLFTIAHNLKRMQVYAKTDESDTGFIKVGGDATFQVDAFSNEMFHGQVSAIHLNACIVQNVATYYTVIDAEHRCSQCPPP